MGSFIVMKQAWSCCVPKRKNMGPKAWGYMVTAVECGCPGPLASFLVVTENYQKTPKQLYLYIYTLYFKYVLSRKWVWNIWSLVVVFRLAFNLLLAVGESFPHTYKEQVGCQSVVTTIYTMVGIWRAEETARESSLQLLSPLWAQMTQTWKFWFSSPADIAQRVDPKAQLWEDNSLFIMSCQEGWGASSQREPLADAAVSPQVHHSYWKWRVSTYIQLPGFPLQLLLLHLYSRHPPHTHTLLPHCNSSVIHISLLVEV